MQAEYETTSHSTKSDPDTSSWYETATSWIVQKHDVIDILATLRKSRKKLNLDNSNHS